MAGPIPLGIRRETIPIPPIEENMVRVTAGPLSLGIEFRVLTTSMLEEHYKKQAILDATLAEFGSIDGIDDSGVSLHVFDGERGTEHLRFDAFGDPHYHYIHPGSHHEVHMFDYFANGDMTEWAIEAISSRTKEMLEHAGASELASRVDQADIDEAIPEIRSLVQKGRQEGIRLDA
jgi:hypothetical protein